MHKKLIKKYQFPDGGINWDNLNSTFKTTYDNIVNQQNQYMFTPAEMSYNSTPRPIQRSTPTSNNTMETPFNNGKFNFGTGFKEPNTAFKLPTFDKKSAYNDLLKSKQTLSPVKKLGVSTGSTGSPDIGKIKDVSKLTSGMNTATALADPILDIGEGLATSLGANFAEKDAQTGLTDIVSTGLSFLGPVGQGIGLGLKLFDRIDRGAGKNVTAFQGNTGTASYSDFSTEGKKYRWTAGKKANRANDNKQLNKNFYGKAMSNVNQNKKVMDASLNYGNQLAMSTHNNLSGGYNPSALMGKNGTKLRFANIKNTANHRVNKMQRGGLFNTNKTQYVDSIINANQDKEWVRRLTQDNTPSILTPPDVPGYELGMISTHLMSDDGKGYVYPHIFKVDNKLKYFKGDDAYNYAKQNNLGIQLPKEQGSWFAANGYKQGTNILKSISKFKEGGKVNVIPDGALHARKHNLSDDVKQSVTDKGIPVIEILDKGDVLEYEDDETTPKVLAEGGEILQHAEIEINEIIFNKELTNKLEEMFKLYKDGDESVVIKAGKLLTYEILENTEDNTGLLESVKV